MANISWYVNRLRAMSVREILWRMRQKKMERAERERFGKQHISITEKVFYQGKEDLRFHVEKLAIASENVNMPEGQHMISNHSIFLLGGYDYEKYRKDWHAGFQTEGRWPLNFSYDLQYKQRDEIGDARTNWELNRHFQFALLACNYYHTGDGDFLTELSELFADWDKANPFLFGISWTSVMEVAIRDINWIYTLGFLRKALQEMNDGRFAKGQNVAEAEAICERLRIGIINMTEYVSGHYSRYSSANNHVIVEASAMGIAGIVMAHEEWTETALSILNHEIPRQNYKDGVNKEVSLHYQSFFMEAVGLLMLTMQRDGRSIPLHWRTVMQKMSRYVADCRGNYGETVVFGDDDAGKILDLEGICESREQLEKRDHYSYVLQLMGLLLAERYTEQINDITLIRLVAGAEIETAMQKPCYLSRAAVCYEEGGVTLMKSEDGEVFVGIDHGELGFGSIAAHGHADALSFQMYMRGKPVFADAGTYIYHMDLENRNAFRQTENHNTVTIKDKNQSEMLGAFLWGKRAKTTLLWHNLTVGNAWEEGEENSCNAPCDVEKEKIYYLEAEHDGYAPVIHKRKFVFAGSELKIYDSLLHVKKDISYGMHFLLGRKAKVWQDEKGMADTIRIMTADGTPMQMQVRFSDETVQETGMKKEGLPVPELVMAWVSEEYGRKKHTEQIRFRGNTNRDITIITTITWEKSK